MQMNVEMMTTKIQIIMILIIIHTYMNIFKYFVHESQQIVV